MDSYTHPYEKTASNLLRVCALLLTLNYFLVSDRTSLPEAYAVFIAIVIFIGMAHLLSKGQNWVKWILLIFSVVDLPVAIIIFPSIIKFSTAAACFSILQCIIQIIATILLFIPYKPTPAADATTPD